MPPKHDDDLEARQRTDFKQALTAQDAHAERPLADKECKNAECTACAVRTGLELPAARRRAALQRIEAARLATAAAAEPPPVVPGVSAAGLQQRRRPAEPATE